MNQKKTASANGSGEDYSKEAGSYFWDNVMDGGGSTAEGDQEGDGRSCAEDAEQATVDGV